MKHDGIREWLDGSDDNSQLTAYKLPMKCSASVRLTVSDSYRIVIACLSFHKVRWVGAVGLDWSCEREDRIGVPCFG